MTIIRRTNVVANRYFYISFIFPSGGVAITPDIRQALEFKTRQEAEKATEGISNVELIDVEL